MLCCKAYLCYAYIYIYISADPSACGLMIDSVRVQLQSEAKSDLKRDESELKRSESESEAKSEEPCGEAIDEAGKVHFGWPRVPPLVHY